jgi:hypothetical protein
VKNLSSNEKSLENNKQSFLNRAYKAAYLVMALLAIPSLIYAGINSYYTSKKNDERYEQEENNKKLDRINEYNVKTVGFMVSTELKLKKMAEICEKEKKDENDLKEFSDLQKIIEQNHEEIIKNYQKIPAYIGDDLSEFTEEYMRNIEKSIELVNVCPKNLDAKSLNNKNREIRSNYMQKTRAYIRDKFPQK